MEVQAIGKRLRVSPRKAQLVANQIRGKSIEEAMAILDLDVQKSARLMKKILDSAIANAETNLGADIDQCTISEVYVNQGARLKRFRARARGRSNRIVKPTCHITIALADNLD